MHDILNKEDITVLVNAFYKKVFADDMLGPVFDKAIDKDHWPEHLEIMVNFWQTNILVVPTYRGNPMQAHIKVDNTIGQTINQQHFDRWLKLWHQTIDENFEGPHADTTKKRAVDMGKLILYKIEQARKGL